MAVDPKNPALPAMALQTGSTEITPAATQIDRADHPAPQPGRVIATINHTHEFMAENTGESFVSFAYLQIGLTDPGQAHLDPRPSGRGLRKMVIIEEKDLSGLVHDRFHAVTHGTPVSASSLKVLCAACNVPDSMPNRQKRSTTQENDTSNEERKIFRELTKRIV
jgi:hypothetical protein